MSLEGKTVIVTGGGRDIGRACAMALAAQPKRLITMRVNGNSSC